MSKHPLEDPAAPAAAIPRPLRSTTVSNQAEQSSAGASSGNNVIAFCPRPGGQVRPPGCRDVSPPQPTVTPPPSGHASQSGSGRVSRSTLSPPQHPLSGPGHGAGAPYPASMSLDDGGGSGSVALPSSAAAACASTRASTTSSGSTPPDWRESAGGAANAVAGSVFAVADAPAATPTATAAAAGTDYLLTALDAAEREELLYLRRRVGELEAAMEAARSLLGDALLGPTLPVSAPSPHAHAPSRRATGDELETLTEPAAADAAASRGAQ